MATYTDDFNRSDGTIAAGNSDWSATVGTILDIDTNQVNGTTGNNISALTSLTFTDDQEAQVTFNALTNFNNAGVAVRMSGSGATADGYACRYEPAGTAVYLDRYDNGSNTNIGSDTNVTYLLQIK